MNSNNTQARLFRFHVPGIEAALAIPIEQMAGVARLPAVTRIPCTPPAILGLGHWQAAPVVLIDLRLVLDPDAQPAAASGYEDFHHVIVKVAFDNAITLVGCPIQAGGQIVSVPLILPGAQLPDGIAGKAVHRAVLIDNTPTLLVDMLRLPSLLAPLQPAG
jgi:chemotaxis signal transduction protein